MEAIPLVIITLDLVVTPLVVSTIMKGKPFQFQFQVGTPFTGSVRWISHSERAQPIGSAPDSPPILI
eukprot:COSAG01_NODE_4200_length_5248_cov_4.151097_1_plen_67_part_00